MSDDLQDLALSMMHEVDPTQGLATQGEQPDEPVEEIGDDVKDSDEPTEDEKGNDEASDEAVEEVNKEEGEDNEESEETDEVESSETDVDNEPSDANDEDLHKITVDGEEVEVSLQDLKDNFAGKEAWDKKFTELNTEREQFQAQQDTFNNNAKQFQELATTGKAQEALDLVCELAGLDRNQFVENYVSQLAPQIAEHLELSPEEREQRALKQQVEHYKTREERRQEQQTLFAQQTELKNQVQSVLETHQIGADRFEELQKELIEFGVENLTPETVGQYHVMITHQDAAVEVLKDINPDLVKDKSAMDYLISLQQNNPGIKQEELKARAEKAFVDALAERVKSDSKATKPKKKGSSKATKKPAKEILTFEDLENINPFDLLN